MGIDSDILYPLPEQEFLAHHLPRGTLKVIHSSDGHDGILIGTAVEWEIILLNSYRPCRTNNAM
jgi:homoserine O-acetyltransferase